jgi:intracellular septation protein
MVERQRIPAPRIIPAMKFLFDLLPVFLFFSAFKYYESRKEGAAELLNGLFGGLGFAGAFLPDQSPILVATVVVILATAGQIAWVWFRHGKVDGMLWTSLALVVFFGGMTLVFRDRNLHQWKPTVLYWLFATVLLVSASMFGKNLIRNMLAEQVVLPEPLWGRLNLAWVGFFAAMGVANLFIAFNYPTDIWVNFKLFGGMGLMLAFIVAQGLWLAKHVQEEKS